MAVIEKVKESKETKLVYELVEERRNIEDCGIVTVYGIRVTEKYDGDEYTKTVSNICANRQKIEKLLEKIRTAELKPDFLMDIVEDFLVEEYALRVGIKN